MENKMQSRLRVILVMIALIMPIHSVLAGDTIPERPRFSIHLGMSTTMSKARIVNDYCRSETDEWFTIGMGFELPVKKVRNLYFVTGLSLITKGISAENDEMSFDVEPGYIEVPALLSYRLRTSEYIDVRFNGGLYGAVGVIGDITRSKWLVTVERKCFGPLRRFDYGVVCGVGVCAGRWVTLDVNLEQGFAQCGGSSQFRFKNRSLVATVGIYLNSQK